MFEALAILLNVLSSKLRILGVARVGIVVLRLLLERHDGLGLGILVRGLLGRRVVDPLDLQIRIVLT